ncbi:MAG: Holliday junction branch migration protein RuvA [Aeromicrobium sp.]
MIAFVRGKVAALTLNSAVIDVGGVGVQVMCAPNTLAALRIGQDSQIATSMVVREDSLTVFGFASTDERDMFDLVQTASGVGPKVAQAMLAVLSPDRLRAAIAGNDLAVLTSVPGIGRKGAERIVLELKDRVGPVAALQPVADTWRGQVQEALLGLGWSARDVDRALDQVQAGITGTEIPDISSLLRDALRTLSRA